MKIKCFVERYENMSAKQERNSGKTGPFSTIAHLNAGMVRYHYGF